MTSSITYGDRRKQLETYFDRTAAEAWSRMTSDAPLGRIRATVRAGRDEMRNTLLSWLPEDLGGLRVLDAGCGTGSFSEELAKRGADVVAIDLSTQLVELAGERVTVDGPGQIEFRVGDMTDPSLGRFDYVVAMDSLIHYSLEDLVGILATFAPRVKRGMVFTFPPYTRLLAAMHTVGRLFPRSERAPDMQPMNEDVLRKRLGQQVALANWKIGESYRVARGFYISSGMRLERA